MSLPCFTTITLLAEPFEPFSAELSDNEMHHMRVKRIRAGEHIILRDQDGNSLEIEVEDYAENQLTGKIVRSLPKKALKDFTLVAGVSRGERMDLTLRSATELGVANIVPALTKRTIVKLADDSRVHAKMRHWTGIIQSAVKQSGRSIAPEICEPVDLMTVATHVSSYDLFIVAWEETSTGDIQTAIENRAAELGKPASQLSVALLIGPEGGLEEAEVEAFVSRGAVTVSMGTTILRCETACIVGSALALHAMGEL